MRYSDENVFVHLVDIILLCDEADDEVVVES